MHKDLRRFEKNVWKVPRDLVHWCLNINSSENHSWQNWRVSHQSWPTPGIRAKLIPVYRSTRCHQRSAQMRAAMWTAVCWRSGSSNRYRGGNAEEMSWLADWDGEQGTKSQHHENGSDGQQQERNKSKHQRQPRHEPQTGEKFKYLGVTVSEEWGSEEAVRARVSVGKVERPIRNNQWQENAKRIKDQALHDCH